MEGVLANGRRHSKQNLSLDHAFAEANSTGVEESARPKDQPASARPAKPALDREQRLAAALRANLRRRKAAMKSAD
jgi:hypothetical protein